MPHLEFDATVTLHNHLQEAGMPPDRHDEAVRAVRAALRGIGGAGMIDIEYVGPCAPDLRFFIDSEWVTLYRHWNAEPMGGGEWEVLRQEIAETVKATLAGLVADRGASVCG